MTKIPNGARLAWVTAAAAQETDDCLLFPHGLSNGYGRVRYEGRERYAHHVVLILDGRQPPEPGQESRHLCGARACCNRRHIVVGTPLENNSDKRDHGRQTHGEAHHTAKLTAAQVAEIRSAPGLQREVAAQFGISQQNVSAIRRGISWVGLDGRSRLRA